MSEHTEDDKDMGVYKSCGNVFADLGVSNPEEAFAKAELAFSIRQRIKAKGISQAEAAELLGTDQAKISLVMNGKVSGFTFDRLVRFLNALDMDVRITVAPASGQQRGKTLVTTA